MKFWMKRMALTRSAARPALILAALVVAACTSAGIVELSPDTYRLSRVDGGGIYANAAAMKASVISEADAFAASRGKIAVPIATHEEALRGRLSTIDYEFRLVPPGDPALTPRDPALPTQLATGETVGKGDIRPAATSVSKPDYYTELIRLDDLRKRGILTEDEFQTLKAKILAGR